MKLNIQLFASGTINGSWEPRSGGKGDPTCRVEWTSTPNNAGNYSTLTANVQVYKSGNSTTTGTFTGTININETNYDFSQKLSPYVWGNWTTIATITATIPHNNNGTKICHIALWFYNTGTSMAGDYTAEDNVTLDTIPRGSTFNTTSWNRDTQRLLTSTLSFPATQNVSGVYHKLQARFMNNGTETTICTRTGVSIANGVISFSFTNAEQQAIYNLMPNETTHYIRMYLYTYTNSTYTNQLGDVSILWWTGLIPTNIVPTASLSYSEGGDVPSTWGVWVKGKSKVNFTLTGTGTYSSTIRSYVISGDGYTYNSSTALTNYLSSAGNITFTGKVTDSRSREGTATQTFSVLDYYNPSFTTTQVQRCDSLGNIDDNGEYLYYNFVGSISSCNGNNKTNTTYKIGYRVKDVGDYTYITIDSNEDSTNESGVLSGVTFNTSITYDIQFAIQDTFTTSTSLQTLDTGFDLMNFNASGKSMAIGKVSEAGANEEKLEIALDTEINNNLNVTGAFTTKGYESLFFNDASGYTILSANAETIYFRPNGTWSGTGQAYIRPNGTMAVNGDINCVTHKYQTDGEYLGTAQTKSFTMSSTTTGSWQKCTNDVSMTLKKGYYLLRYSIHLTGSGSGLATLNAGLDGSRLGSTWRQTIPVASSLVTSAIIMDIQYFSTDAAHTFSCYTYNNVNCGGNSGYIEAIKLN